MVTGEHPHPIEGGFNNQDTVDQSAVFEYKELNKHGPIVGYAEVKKREPSESVNVEVRVKKESDSLRFNLVKDGRLLAFIDLSEIPNFNHLEAKPTTIEAGQKIRYDNNSNNLGHSKIFIDAMQSQGEIGAMVNGGTAYKGLGTALHRIAVERSFQVGSEGRVLLKIKSVPESDGYTKPENSSVEFHETFGFLAQDVYKPDGTIHHTGESIHEKTALRRAYLWKNYVRGDNEPYTKKDLTFFNEAIKSETYTTPFQRTEEVYMYLPPEISERETKNESNSDNHS